MKYLVVITLLIIAVLGAAISLTKEQTDLETVTESELIQSSKNTHVIPIMGQANNQINGEQQPLPVEDLNTLLALKPLESISRSELKNALSNSPDQLIDLIKALEDMTPKQQRLILDVVYQFSDQYREQVALEFLKSNSEYMRATGYKLLASSSSENTLYAEDNLTQIIDASYAETPLVIEHIFATLTTHEFSAQLQPLLLSRIEQLTEPTDSQTQIYATQLLIKLKQTQAYIPRVLAQLQSGKTSLIMQTLDSLYMLEKVPTLIEQELNKLASTDNATATEVKESAKALLAQTR